MQCKEAYQLLIKIDRFCFFFSGNSLHGIPGGDGYGSMTSPAGMYGNPMGPQAHQTMNVPHHQGTDGGHGGLMDLSQTQTSSMSSKHEGNSPEYS